MAVTRQHTVEHGDWGAIAEKLEGTKLPDPAPGEEKLVCTRAHAVRNVGTKIVLEVIYEEPVDLVASLPPAPFLKPKQTK